MTVRSKELATAMLLRQGYIERTKNTRAARYGQVTEAVFVALSKELAKLSDDGLARLSLRNLRALVSRVLAAHDQASAVFVDSLTEWTAEFIQLEDQFTVRGMNRITGEDRKPDENDGYSSFWLGLLGATGLSAKESITTFARSQARAIKKLLQRAHAQKWTAKQTVTALRGTQRLGFKDGLARKLQNAASSLVGTIIQAASSFARSKAYTKFMDKILGYTWVSILDTKTSATCRSLSGRVFKFGEGPLPPAHYNCRSHIEPLFIRAAMLVTGGTLRAAENAPTFYSWLKKQSISVQEQALGKTRSKLFRDGGLTEEEFARKVVDARFEPLTLEQLRASDPAIFEAANL